MFSGKELFIPFEMIDFIVVEAIITSAANVGPIEVEHA